jgi:hypothetical protein
MNDELGDFLSRMARKRPSCEKSAYYLDKCVNSLNLFCLELQLKDILNNKETDMEQEIINELTKYNKLNKSYVYLVTEYMLDVITKLNRDISVEDAVKKVIEMDNDLIE